MKRVIDKATPLSTGIVITLVSTVVAGIFYINSLSADISGQLSQIDKRLVVIETVMKDHLEDPNIHQQKLKELEEEMKLTRELLVVVKEMKERLLRIETKLDQIPK